MYRFVFLISFTLFSGELLANQKKLIGEWKCHSTSEYAGYDSTISLKKDMSYKNEWSLFGTQHVEIGLWHLDDSSLILDRKKYVKNNIEKESSQKFKREIILIEKPILELKHNGAKTLCKSS